MLPVYDGKETTFNMPLPLEIQEKIIVALYSSSSSLGPDPLTDIDGCGEFTILNKCTLACRAYLRICRRLRFAVLQVNCLPDDPFESSAKLINILEKPARGLLADIPPIASYIRSLYFGVTNRDIVEFREALPRALRKLTQLESLSIRYHDVSHLGPRIDWSCPQVAPLANVVSHLIQLPTLRTLALGTGVRGFPVSALHGSGVKKLFIEDATLCHGHGPNPTMQTTSVRLEEFHPVTLSGSEVNKLIQPLTPGGDALLDLSEVKILTWTMDPSPGCETATRRIFSCLQHPQRLNLSAVETTFEGLHRHIKPYLGTLVQVRLTIPSTFPFMPAKHTLSAQLRCLTSELRSLRSEVNNNIEALVLTYIHLWTTDNSENILKEWEALDGALVPSEDGKSWGSLKTIILMASGSGLTKGRFKKLSASKRVAFHLKSSNRR